MSSRGSCTLKCSRYALTKIFLKSNFVVKFRTYITIPQESGLEYEQKTTQTRISSHCIVCCCVCVCVCVYVCMCVWLCLLATCVLVLTGLRTRNLRSSKAQNFKIKQSRVFQDEAKPRTTTTTPTRTTPAPQPVCKLWCA